MAVNHVAAVAHRRAGRGLELQDGHRVAYRRQRIAQLVREHREEFIHLARRMLEIAQPAAFGHVARHLGKSQMVAVGTAYGRNDDVGPERRAVLAHAPALFLGAALQQRVVQLLGRQPRSHVLAAKEHAVVLAYDLLRGIALDELRAAVPALDLAQRVQHVDCIVAHALDQQPEALLALAQRLLLQAPLGQVARDLAETGQAAVGIAQRGDHHVRPENVAVLAHAPAFLFVGAVLRRKPQFMVGPHFLLCGLGVEDREMPAYDLVGAIPLEPDCTRVPGQHDSRRVEHEDRVVLNGFDQQTETIRARGSVVFLLVHGFTEYVCRRQTGTMADNAREGILWTS